MSAYFVHICRRTLQTKNYERILIKMKKNSTYVFILIVIILTIFVIRHNKKPEIKEILLSDLKPGETAILIKKTCPTCKRYSEQINKLLKHKLVYFADMTKSENIAFVKDNVDEPVSVPSKIYFDSITHKIIFTNEKSFIKILN